MMKTLTSIAISLMLLMTSINSLKLAAAAPEVTYKSLGRFKKDLAVRACILANKSLGRFKKDLAAAAPEVTYKSLGRFKKDLADYACTLAKKSLGRFKKYLAAAAPEVTYKSLGRFKKYLAAAAPEVTQKSLNQNTKALKAIKVLAQSDDDVPESSEEDKKALKVLSVAQILTSSSKVQSLVGAFLHTSWKRFGAFIGGVKAADKKATSSPEYAKFAKNFSAVLQKFGKQLKTDYEVAQKQEQVITYHFLNNTRTNLLQSSSKNSDGVAHAELNMPRFVHRLKKDAAIAVAASEKNDQVFMSKLKANWNSNSANAASVVKEYENSSANATYNAQVESLWKTFSDSVTNDLTKLSSDIQKVTTNNNNKNQKKLKNLLLAERIQVAKKSLQSRNLSAALISLLSKNKALLAERTQVAKKSLQSRNLSNALISLLSKNKALLAEDKVAKKQLNRWGYRGSSFWSRWFN